MMLHYSEVFRLAHISLSSPENLLMNTSNIQYSIVIIPSRFSLFNQQKQLEEKMRKEMNILSRHSCCSFIHNLCTRIKLLMNRFFLRE